MDKEMDLECSPLSTTIIPLRASKLMPLYTSAFMNTIQKEMHMKMDIE